MICSIIGVAYLILFCFTDIDTPTKNISSATATLNETDVFFVECGSASYPAATYQWKTSTGDVLSRLSVLSFVDINRRESGSYTCTAANAAGKKSLVISIIVNCE